MRFICNTVIVAVLLLVAWYYFDRNAKSKFIRIISNLPEPVRNNEASYDDTKCYEQMIGDRCYTRKEFVAHLRQTYENQGRNIAMIRSSNLPPKIKSSKLHNAISFHQLTIRQLRKEGVHGYN